MGPESQSGAERLQSREMGSEHQAGHGQEFGFYLNHDGESIS